MARRFVTVEDIRRLSGSELVIGPDTIVTPQALEAAQASGVVIKSGGGAAYEEPVPDRGPDSHREMQSLPNLPEPASDDPAGIGLVVTVVGRNRPGVLAELTSALGDRGVNIGNISQKMVDDFFHLVITAYLPPGGDFDELSTHFECMGGPDDYVARVMHERVFRFMHRI